MPENLESPNLEGHRITQYLGIVTGEAILGANFLRDFLAGMRDIIGGRAGAYESTLRRAKDIALQEMADRATKLRPVQMNYPAASGRGIRIKKEPIPHLCKALGCSLLCSLT